MSQQLPRRTPAQMLSIVLLGVVILVLALRFVLYLRYALAEIAYPFEVFDAEGIVWQQAMLIPGSRMYGDITRYPFIVFHYPPLYHLCVHGLSVLGINPLEAGRGVSVLATLLTGGLIAAVVMRAARPGMARLARNLGAAAGGLVYFSFWPVIAVSPLLRVDMLAVALSFAGLRCAMPAEGRRGPYYGAMVLFVMSVFTKQTSLLAPMSMLLVLLLIEPKFALRLFGFGLLAGGIPLAVLTWITDGGFLRHLTLYNINRFSLSLMADQLLGQLPQAVFLLLAVVGVVVAWRQVASGHRRAGFAAVRQALRHNLNLRAMAMLSLYLVLSTGSLMALGKSGGGLNYYVEWMAVLSVVLGLMVAAVAEQQSPGENNVPAPPRMLGLLVPLLLLAQLAALPVARDFGPNSPADREKLQALQDRVGAAPKPVLSTDMVMLMQSGKGVPWEPAIFHELASTGLWDEQLIVAMIENHAFSFVITRPDSQFTPAVAQAIATAYPVIEEQAWHILHLPPH